MTREEIYICPRCRFEFSKPELPDGYMPGPYDRVVCVNCGEVNLALIYEGYDPKDLLIYREIIRNQPKTIFNTGLSDEE